MSDNEGVEQPLEKPFVVDRAKTGRAGCKKCKQKIAQGELRLGKLGFCTFTGGPWIVWHHVSCMFEVFKRQRPTTKKIETPDDLEGWDDLHEDDKKEVISHFPPELKTVFEKHICSPVKKKKGSPIKKVVPEVKDEEDYKNHRDNAFKTFRKICVTLTNSNNYLVKTKMLAEFFDKGSDYDFFKGDIELWCKLLLPGAVGRAYNLQNKQLVKIFSKIFELSHEEMLEDLEQGDGPETISKFFDKSRVVTPCFKSTLTIQEVSDFLEKLSRMSKEEEQLNHLKEITQKCTVKDLKMVLRLIKHDLKINAGPKHILEALHKDAYRAFLASRDLKGVIDKALKAREESGNERDKSKSGVYIGLKIMTPIFPMLATPCRSLQMAFKKCPNGMYSEIKYDGERVQVHKLGNTFKFFSRSLKPVLPSKVDFLQDYIPKAFPHVVSVVLDAEILLVDRDSGKPLPFGTLGVHKKNEFKNANVCLFVFDCMFVNGKSLLDIPIKARKDILRKNMIEIKNRIMLAEMDEIYKAEDLEKMITKVFKQGLEGLVLKDVKSTYKPGKRHWLKVKRDYLFDGAMADSADLVVLGAWFGTGSKGGIMSSFLMGCYNPRTKKWVTVTKVSGGLDDKTLENVQRELKMKKISKNPAKVPTWLKCTKKMIPDFVAIDPKKMPVWEVTGAEFSCSQIHTAHGISIRFPRVTKMRDDKDWSTATNLDELKDLYKKSKNTADFSLDKETASEDSTEDDADDEDEEDNVEDDDDDENAYEETTVKGEKRENESGDEGESCKKMKVEEDTEDCTEYHEDTDTDTEDDAQNETAKSKVTNSKDVDVENPLPNIFTGCVIRIPKQYKNYNFLRRYVIAYDGLLYDTEKRSSLESSERKITHDVHLDRVADLKAEKCWAKNVRHVHINWIWDSIKLLERQPEKRYVVTAKNDNVPEVKPDKRLLS